MDNVFHLLDNMYNNTNTNNEIFTFNNIKYNKMKKKIKLIQNTMISTLNFSQQEIDNVKNYSNELINEIIEEITEYVKLS